MNGDDVIVSPEGRTRPSEERLLNTALKRVTDVVGAGVGLAVTGGVLAGAACVVRLTMGAPLLFRQERPGKDGRAFELLKFRTMRHEQVGEVGPEFDAVRMTPVGRFLRATSIDELPTLLNVLKGEMSLVGPRPLLMRYLPRYSPTQARRHEAKPGVTGWAQINGRNTISWDEKFALDVWYVDNWSLWLDAKILFLTVLKVLRRDGIDHSGTMTMPEFMGTQVDERLQQGGEDD